MKYHILHSFRTSTPCKEKSYDLFKGRHKLKLLSDFNVKLTTSLGGEKKLCSAFNSLLLLEMKSD